METSPNSVILKLAKQGILRSSELKVRQIPRVYLTRLCDEGKLERIGRGLYRIPSASVTEFHSLAEVAVRIPHATICLLSALQFHQLTTVAPHNVWIMIETHARMPKVDFQSIKVVRASGPALSFGIEEHLIEDEKARITSQAKTVADCFRYRSHVGLDIALEALRDYLQKNPKSGVSALMRAAKVDRVANVIRPYVEAMV